MAGRINTSVSAGVVGMNRGTHSHLLDEKAYTFARNANLETDLETMALTNEHSNILCNRLNISDREQVVVGYKYDSLGSRLILFLTDKYSVENPNYDPNDCNSRRYVRQSQIGYIPVISDYHDESDIEQDCGCDIVSILSSPLEDFKGNFPEHCKYTQIISDCEDVNYCLNFDPDYPIKDVVLKKEACGTMMVFTSENNPPRYINIDDTESYKTKGLDTCDSSSSSVCIDCSKLLLFPEYNPLYIVPNEIVYGGNLNRGMYDFYVAYCDKEGSELTEYMSATNSVSIFDSKNIRLDETTLFGKTSSGIHLKLENNDLRFDYLKVVVVEKISKDVKGVSAFVVGVYPSSTTDVYYTANSVEQSDKRIPFNVITASKPIYKRFKGLASSGGHLFGYGYEVEKEWNLQPVVSLLGTFLKWHSSEAGENLYADGVNDSLFKGYMRDEVYPFGIRFRTTSGYKTSIFPLVGRPARNFEKHKVDITKDDVNSILELSQECSGNIRDEYWQYYNTANELGRPKEGIVRGAVKVEFNTEVQECVSREAILLENGRIEMNLSDDYVDLKDWIERYGDQIKTETDPESPYYSEVLKELLNRDLESICDPEDLFGVPICDSKDDCISKYCDENSPYYDKHKCFELNNNCPDGSCFSVCGNIEKVEGEGVLRLGEVIGDRITKLEKLKPWETGDDPKYEHGITSKEYKQFPIDEYDQRDKIEITVDAEIIGEEMDAVGFKTDKTVRTTTIFSVNEYHERIFDKDNTDCEGASDINSLGNHFVPKLVGKFDINGIIINPSNNKGWLFAGRSKEMFLDIDGTVLGKEEYEEKYEEDIFSRLYTNVPSKSIEGVFGEFIPHGALWYKLNFEGNDEYLFEITPINKSQAPDNMVDDKIVRITVVDKCNPKTYLFSDTYNPKEGYWKSFKKSDFNKSSVYIILDTPVKDIEGSYNDSSWEENKFIGETKYSFKSISALSGSFNVVIRPKEYFKQIVEFDKLTFSYSQNYTATCYYPSPKSVDCGVNPYRYGMFSYWESILEYPSNSDLYDSSGIKVDLSRLRDIEDEELVELFAQEYLDKQTLSNISDGYSYEVNDKGDFRCKPIRHFKFPDNKVSPFMNTYKVKHFQESEIYPLGVSINNETVELFLDFAVEAGLIDSCQRKEIVGYDIFRGDRLVKSVLTRGILNDMYRDPVDSDSNKEVLFRNYPYNTLGSNAYITTDGKNNLLKHPFNSDYNNRFSFISPELYLDSSNIPATELTVDGYVYGHSETQWEYVKNHSEWVILGEIAKKEAARLATLEALFEFALTMATFYVENQKNDFVIRGRVSGQTNGVISGDNKKGKLKTSLYLGTFAAVQAANSMFFRRPKYELQWLQIAEDKGGLSNHAQYSVSPKGFYNRFSVNKEEDNYLRGINKLIYLTNTRVSTIEQGSKLITINNLDRENSYYISLGNYRLNYPNSYKVYDNFDISPRSSSRVTVGGIGKCSQGNPKHIGKIASPYVTLKRYVPDQYGEINSIKWLSTGNRPYFKNKTTVVYGGDVYITRVDFKNKYRYFTADAIGVQHRTPFKYRSNQNIGYPTYYADYKSYTGISSSLVNKYFVDTEKCLDCDKGSYYYEPNTKRFYLFHYGVPHFLVESTINGEYRYAGSEPHEQFASMGIDMVHFTQEANVPIHTHETFKYNDVYSWSSIGLPGTMLPSTYDKEKYDCLAIVDNGVAWSDMDSNEESLSNPWLIFRSMNNYRFPFSFGKLVSLDNIESNVVLGRFTDNLTIFNAVDVLRDRVNVDNAPMGNGGIFASGRPQQFSNTELGETGTQHKEFITTEFGHYWVDARRGKVFHLQPGGKGLQAISDFKSGGSGESGMRRWFKRHLPFKILKQGIEGLMDTDLDNKFKGLGISMGWDSRFKRLFITKLDYVVKKRYKGKVKYSSGKFYVNDLEVFLQDTEYFKNVSWTVSYSPIYGQWISYYDFKPDFYISHNEYFQTGINYPEKGKDYRKGIWSHLLSNKSYQVFYGDYYPFEIEYIVKNTYTNNVLKDLKVWAYSHRYHNNFDYAQWRGKSFNKIVVYNQTNNSGILSVDYNNTLSRHLYPKYISSTEQLIQGSHIDEQLSVNYFYNRVKDEDSGVPIWLNDDNEINKILNPSAISFTSKKVLERLRGDWFSVRLIQDNTSQFKQVFKWGISSTFKY